MSECDSISRTIRKGMQDSRRKFQLILIQFIGPPKPTEILLQVIPRKIADIATLEQDINIYFEENSPYQEHVILKMYQRPDKSYFQEPPELLGIVSSGELVQTFLPKQADIDKILKIIQRKVLKGTHL